MSRVIIVGGGISGLATAFRLQQRAPHTEITLLEKNARPGGTLWTEEHDGFRLELGANGFLDNKPTTLALCRDLGLGDDLIAASDSAGRNRYLFWNGRLQLLPNGVNSFLSSRLLSWRGKLGLLMERFRRPRRDQADESIAAFARRRAGAEVADVLADAIVTGVHAGDPEQLSIRAAFPRMVEFEEKYGSVIRGFSASARQRGSTAGGIHMWSFRAGLRRLSETLAARLSRSPVLGVGVRRLEPATDGSG
ncbi:MAG TPA: protoporphyrinogen oxidase, partial [Gemmataceae bacterium]|nr:protoporphyrinogen oxidase [Gemmataceae bacterium]